MIFWAGVIGESTGALVHNGVCERIENLAFYSAF